jgi:tRNA dimethylallyltransferase
LLDVEIISADSAQVYKGMDVGTAKPSPEILESVPHHLINIRDPADPYSAADFRADAERLVPEIAGRGKVPLIVGGTMLYLKALNDGLANLPEADASMRAEISLR